MKQVKIVTFHKAHNYGAVLQAYALKKKLTDLGVNASFYDYSPYWLTKKYGLFKRVGDYKLKEVIKKAITVLCKYKASKSRYVGFENFIANYLKSNESIENKNVDYIFVGSDQIWNPNITNGFDEECFGIIQGLSADKIVSYAASMEQLKLSHEEQIYFSELLKNIDYISVREDSLRHMMLEKQVTTNNVEHVLDPTLLLTNCEWDEISEPKAIDSKYLLVYENYLDEKTRTIARKIASKLNLKVVTISTTVAWNHKDDVLNDISPSQYLTLFKNASFVLTTSYHGLAFAINYRIPFYSINVSEGVNNRALSLLNLLDLQERLIDVDKFNINSHSLDVINYELVHKKLETQRIKSIDFIRQVVEE